MKDFSIKITKTTSIHQGTNFEEFLIYGRIYNYNKTKYRKFAFVLTLDYDSMFEYYEKDKLSKEEIKIYKYELIDSFTCYIKSYNNTMDFYTLCQESINNYNKYIKNFNQNIYF